jgi:hypothetical protein
LERNLTTIHSQKRACFEMLQMLGLVNTAMNLSVSDKAGDFSASEQLSALVYGVSDNWLITVVGI